jgi:hydroxymethylpyrimidine/phosphomethylpyrimidine kinase
METDRYYVLGQLVTAVNMLRESATAYRLLPEIRSNPVMACEHAESINDIAGIPGRLTEVFGRITACAYPAWGASRFTAAILLAVRRIRPSARAAMEIRYHSDIVNIISGMGHNAARMDIQPGSTLDEVLGRCAQKSGELPGILYTEGGFAREGAIIITGESAVQVAETVIAVADAYATGK